MIKYHQMLNIGAFYIWTGFRPVVFAFSPEFFEAILKNPSNLQKSFGYTFLSLWLKEGLIVSEGNKWKQRRKAITSAFHFRILEDFVSVFDCQSNFMIKKLKEATAGGKVVDIVPYTTKCTLDIICETSMGIKLRAQDDGDAVYLTSMHKVCEAFISRLLRPWLWPNWIYFNTHEGKMFKENIFAMDKFTRQVIQEKKAEVLSKLQIGEESGSEKKRKVFLDLLLDLHLCDPEKFTEEDIQEEVDSFMFAGHDTTAVGTSWTLYMIGLYPEVQEKLIEEIDAVFGNDINKPITEDCLRELKYLECVIKESQRIYPPAPFIARHTQEDVEIDGLKIPKGTTCMLVIYMLHRNKDMFPDPETFDPDRFLPENSIKRHPFAYCPFSAGPRNCIGQKFAMMEEKTMIANVLRHFRIQSMEQRDKLKLAAEMVLRSRNGIKVKLIPRR
ncbi:cytochrome P450 4c3-like [Stegodyphus dumicola]|uniref:cytochrome P450 4c3-like n=1 Tax=Stegodyphus dumicola TaxID=202533 RepID=UPI0015B19B08|nr:cytochrome P450 4c3-like [Stegodyphus dumicola]